MGFPGSSDGKASACNAGDLGSIPGSGRFPGEGNGNPLQDSCLGNSMDTGAWQLQSMGSQRIRLFYYSHSTGCEVICHDFICIFPDDKWCHQSIFLWYSRLSVTEATVHHRAKRNMADLGIKFYEIQWLGLCAEGREWRTPQVIQPKLKKKEKDLQHAISNDHHLLFLVIYYSEKL